MIFTLFLLPALLPANAIVLPLEPHWTSLKPATTGFIQARNRPPPGFVAEDGQGGHGGSAAPNDHVVNAVAAGSSQGDDEEYECEEWEEDADTAAPNDRTVVNTAATGSSMDEEGDECDEEEEEGGAEHPPNDQTVVNAAATGSSMDEGGDECHEEEEEGGAEPAQNDQTVVNTAATGSSMDEDRDECDEEEEGGAEQAPNETMAVNAVATGSSRGGEGSNGGSPNPAGGQGSGPSGGQGGGPPGEGRPPDSGPAGNGGNSHPEAPATSAPIQSAQSSTQAAAPPSTSASQPRPAGESGKDQVGLAWAPDRNSADLSTYIANGLEWWYDWKLEPSSMEAAIEYVPQVWGPADVPNVQQAVTRWPAGTKHVFSFNEPDIKDGQAGQYLKDTREAATLHKQISDTLGSNYWLGTPAVATGVGWLKEWRDECDKIGGCRHDFVTAHFYGTTAQALIDMLKGIHAEFGQDGKKIWLTEWGCHQFNAGQTPARSCSPEEADAMMQEGVAWFRGEGKDVVDRWAWFGAFDDMNNWDGKYNMDANRIANADGTINDKGKKYLSL